MSENKDFWSSYFSGDADVPDFKRNETTGETQKFTVKDAQNTGGQKTPDKGFDEDYGDTGPKSFKVDFDFDGEYRDVPTVKPMVRRREKRSGCVGGILYGIFIICVSVIFGCFLWMAAVDVLALGKPDSEIILTVPESVFYEGVVDVEDEEGKVIGEEKAQLADVKKVAELMYDNGLIKYKGLFEIFCKFSNAEEKIGPGTYTLNTKFDYRALVYGTTPGSAQLVEVEVTIPEGYTLRQIFERLEEKEVCSADALWDIAATYEFEENYEFLVGIPEIGDKYRLEGYLFPDTYKFYVGDDPVRVIKKFLNNFEVKFGQLYIDRAAELGYTIHDIVTIASMIEREASSHEGERDLIASVIYNRITSGFTRLQIDATILYGMDRNGDGDKPLTTGYDTPYNTYMYEGLPPGPIANPGEASIRGALYPEDTRYYYYALHRDEGSGTWHEFFTNYDSFLSFINSEDYGG